MPSSEISSNSLIQSSAEHSASEESSAQPSPNPPAQPSESAVKKQPTSERRIDANRRNALLSTGPKSVRGKENAALNSLKHGLLAKSILIMQGPAKENKAEFDELLNGLCEYFKPVGTAEELLVEEIAISYWMERRAQVYENLEIRKQSWSEAREPEPWKELGYYKGDDEWISDLHYYERYKLLRRPDGVKHVLDIVMQLKNLLERENKYSQELLEHLAEICGGVWETELKKETHDRATMLALLKREKKKLQLLQKRLERNAAKRRVPNLGQVALLLNDDKREVLQRYTTAHQKRRDRVLAQLERLQRQRSGETIFAPASVLLTGDSDDFAKRSQ
jgi:hypothetical protein